MISTQPDKSNQLNGKYKTTSIAREYAMHGKRAIRVTLDFNMRLIDNFEENINLDFSCERFRYSLAGRNPV